MTVGPPESAFQRPSGFDKWWDASGSQQNGRNRRSLSKSRGTGQPLLPSIVPATCTHKKLAPKVHAVHACHRRKQPGCPAAAAAAAPRPLQAQEETPVSYYYSSAAGPVSASASPSPEALSAASAGCASLRRALGFTGSAGAEATATTGAAAGNIAISTADAGPTAAAAARAPAAAPEPAAAQESAIETMMTTALKDEEWIRRLDALGQSHVIPRDATPQEIRSLCIQLQQADAAYPGGLAMYLERARELLAAAKTGTSPFAGYIASKPEGERLTVLSTAFDAYEKAGLQQHVGCSAFVLVAGGLGERLGYRGIKIGLPCEVTTFITFAQLYCEYILAFQAARDAQLEKWQGRQNEDMECTASRSEEAGSGGAPLHCSYRGPLPLAIMTSDDTHERTVELFEENNFYGLKRGQVTFMKQGKVPALVDDAAHLATERVDSEDQCVDSPSSSTTLKLLVKPHGHGDVHTLLHQHNLVKKWKQQGIRWIVFFQDTNVLAFRAIPVALGVSAAHRFALNTIAVPRKASEAMGALCLLTSTQDGHSLTLNVEYNVLGPLLKAQGSGDVPNAAGCSDFPGNTNALIFSMDPYCCTLQRTGGTVPEFVNPKYKDNIKTAFKSPTRLECMMQDLPRLFLPQDGVGFTELERWFCYSPVKNNAADAALKAAQHVPPECALSGEADLYHNNTRLLELVAARCGAAVDMGTPEQVCASGVRYAMGPRILLSPSWAVCASQMKSRLEGLTHLKVTSRSTLVIEGEVFVKHLELDGAAVLRACTGSKLVLEHLVIKNEGWPLFLSKGSQEEPPSIALRGYKFEHRETYTVQLEERGIVRIIDDRGETPYAEQSLPPDPRGDLA